MATNVDATELNDHVDPLGEALHVLRMSSSFYSNCAFTALWGLGLPAIPNALMFHIVTSGLPWLEVDGAAPRLLQPGDLALVPHGDGHRLISEPGLPAIDLWDLPHRLLSERYEILRIDGGGAATTMLCGTIAFDHPAAHHLIAVLPRLIAVEAGNALRNDWIQSSVRFIAAEARDLRPGGETVITRLADVLVIQAIRAWIEGDPAAQTGWLGALRDPQIGRAISLIHRDPSRNWSVARLAHEVAMSRSAFAARFSDLVGETPMSYVARWRMQVAATSLREERSTLGELALRLGYGSEAAFSRAFKRIIGVSPGAVRRAASTS
jgi:AraC-like DNA-binding protein